MKIHRRGGAVESLRRGILFIAVALLQFGWSTKALAEIQVQSLLGSWDVEWKVDCEDEHSSQFLLLFNSNGSCLFNRNFTCDWEINGDDVEMNFNVYLQGQKIIAYFRDGELLGTHYGIEGEKRGCLRAKKTLNWPL